jgi:hypothetical protein
MLQARFYLLLRILLLRIETMPSFVSTLRAAVAAGLLFLVLTASSSAQAGVGHIIGNIDGISHDGEQTYISGWACQQGQSASIMVQVFTDDSTGDPGKRTLVVPAWANLESEPAVDKVCHDAEGGAHRFLILMPPDLFAHGDKKLYVHGIRVVNGVPNDAIAGSGTKLKELPGLAVPHPTLPVLSGNYRSLAAHPRVFTTANDLSDLVSRINVSRINRPGSYSKQRFSQLAAQITRDLASQIDWDAAYSGCRVKTYLLAFSYEPQEPGFLATLSADTKPRRGTEPPAGAAIVASRAALYAVLVKAGATVPAGAPSEAAASALAKRILLAWADHGFRNDQGGYRSVASFNCDDDGKLDLMGDAGTGLPLTLGRGVIYSVHAQDLLQSLNVLDASEVSRLNAFHSAIFDLIRQSDNKRSSVYLASCDRFSNQQANAEIGLLAIARLLDDPRRFKAVLDDDDPQIPLVLPWTEYFDHAIYGENDRPISCYKNSGSDSMTSHPFYETSVVAPGEVEDRYRNAYPAQGIGYPMFSLEQLIDAAEIMQIAGLDAYGYRGRHQQSIEMAIQYYACYGKGAGFGKVVGAANAGSCPDAAQYYGKVVNGVDPLVVFGAYCFPANKAITDMETAAKISSSSGPFALDAILFGKWRD